MGTKAEELHNLEIGQGCLAKADPQEPVFILRGQDMFAPKLVRQWAIWAKDHGCYLDKVNEAFELANKMERWQRDVFAKYPD